MSLDEISIDIDVLFNDKNNIPNCFLNKLYIPPQIIPISLLDIENNSSGSGDGDAAFAHS